MKPKSNNFYYSLWPTFFINTVLGIFPMVPKGKRLYSPKKFKLITTLYIAFYSYLIAYIKLSKSDNITGQNFYSKDNAVSNFGLRFQFFCGIIMFYTIAIASFFKTRNVKEVMQMLYSVDNKLISIGQIIPYRKCVVYQIIFFVSGASAIISIACAQNYNIYVENLKPVTVEMWIVFIYPIMLVNVFYCEVTVMVYAIYARLNMVSEFLQRLAEGSFKSNEILGKVNVLVRVYDMLLEASKRTNRNFDIQMIPCLCNQLFLVAYQIFYFYWMFSETPHSTFCWLAWGSLKFVELVQVAATCDIAAKEVQAVGNSVHKILAHNNNSDIRKELMTFSHRILHTKCSYTICGLFMLDARLLLDIVGSSATFIVMMIQFQETISPTICNFNATLLEQ